MADISGDLIFAGTVQTLSTTTASSIVEADSPHFHRTWIAGHYEYVVEQRGPNSSELVKKWVPGHWELIEDQSLGTVSGTVTSKATLCEYLKIHWEATQETGGTWTVVLTAFMCTSSPGEINYTGYLDGRITLNGTTVADFSMSTGGASCQFGAYGVYNPVKSGGSDWSVTKTGVPDGTVIIGIAPNPSTEWAKFCNSCGSGVTGGYGFETATKSFALSGAQPVDPDTPSEPSTLPVRVMGSGDDLVILDTDFTPVAIVDEYESLIWTDRYNKYGDFELVLPVSAASVSFVKQDRYLYRPQSYYLMIIESVKLESDAQDGDRMIISGRSLESILERRVIWGQTVFSISANTGNFQNAVRQLLYDSMISPSDSKRRIPNVQFRASNDPAVTRLTVNTEFDGETVYEAVQALCEAAGIGFRMLPDGEWNFVFELYAGTDHSYQQPSPAVNPYVVFSPNYDNLSDSNYLSTTEPYRNTALVAGEGEGSDRVKVEVTDSGQSYSGLSRREIFVDAKSTSSKTDDGQLSSAEYKTLLEGKGLESLADNTMEIAFDGEALPAIGFTYGTDYFLGDIVQIENAYGMAARARVTEYIVSESTDGREAYPTFTVL